MMANLKVYRIKVPELWYQTYYVRATNAENAFTDFRQGMSIHKVGKVIFEESFEHYDGWEWDVEEVRDPSELGYVRTLPLSPEVPRG